VFFTYSSQGATQGGAVGDLRLSASFSFLNPAQQDPFELGATAYLDTPTGFDQEFLGESAVAGGLVAAASGEVGKLTLSADLGLQFNPAISLGNLSGADDVLLGGAANVLVADNTGIGLEARLSAPMAANPNPGSSTPAEAMVTARHRTDSGGFFSAGLGTALSGGAGAANWRLLVGGGFGVIDSTPKDTDGDGIVDKIDACVADPETMNGYKDEDGCPDQLGTMAVHAEYQGKRVPGAALEVNDGVNPTVSKTVGSEDLEITAVPGTGFTASASSGACLAGKAAKSAGEGRTELAVPLEAVREAAVSLDVVTDAGKPVPNASIAWATEPTACVPEAPATVGPSGHLDQVLGVGSHSWRVSADGYAVVQDTLVLAKGETKPLRVVLKPTRVKITHESIQILDMVQFETAKATIKPESFGLLDEVAATILAHPEMAKIEVGGHTDSQGSDASNLTLSQNRANAVRDYLVKKGVAAARLTAVGYGELKPIATNKTANGRAENRRVEFKILASDPG
jgi:outer membrane protein OmpA-like peptidoglycan-associated protein